MLRLRDYWRSSASYRVRIALNLKRVAYERVPVDLLSDEQRGEANRRVNAQGFVPTLVLADGTALIQSLAIIDWLDHAYPDPPLLPADPLARARTLAQALVIAADIHPLDNLRVLRRLEQQFGAGQTARDDWYRHWIAQGFDALEMLAGDGRFPGGPFLGGEAPSLADVCLVPQMYNARRMDMPLDAYPRLVAADAAAGALDGFVAAHPERHRP